MAMTDLDRPRDSRYGDPYDCSTDQKICTPSRPIVIAGRRRYFGPYMWACPVNLLESASSSSAARKAAPPVMASTSRRVRCDDWRWTSGARYINTRPIRKPTCRFHSQSQSGFSSDHQSITEIRIHLVECKLFRKACFSLLRDMIRQGSTALQGCRTRTGDLAE